MTASTTAATLINELDAKYKDDPTTVELCLCDTTSWTTPTPTNAEVIASVIAEANGYTHQDVTPTTGATESAGVVTLNLQNATVSLSSGTLDYGGFAIIVDLGLAGEDVAGVKNIALDTGSDNTLDSSSGNDVDDQEDPNCAQQQTGRVCGIVRP